MTNENGGQTEDRRKVLKSRQRREFLKTMAHASATTAVVLAAPAIIGRAMVSTAKAAFEGEGLIAVSWSGNYELVFRETVIDPFNAKYNTKAETIGGWNEMVSQIKAAPPDNPPFDVTIAEEFITSSGLLENMWLPADKTKIPNLDAVYPWFYETRPESAAKYGIPFGGGTCMLLLRKKLGLDGSTWKTLWHESLANRLTLDGGTWYWPLSIPAVLNTAVPGLDEMYDIQTAEPLFAELEKLKVSKWFKDGAEQANILNQEEADAAVSYSSDAYTFLQGQPDEYTATVPSEGASGWTDWYFKVRGTQHNDLADLFLNYLLEKETQERFLSKSLIYVSRRDITPPAHWGDAYPKNNEDYYKKFQVLTMEGWDKMSAAWDAFDNRAKQMIAKTTAG
jgi:spermidine/putrescine transport system substrate-binding protein